MGYSLVLLISVTYTFTVLSAFPTDSHLRNGQHAIQNHYEIDAKLKQMYYQLSNLVNIQHYGEGTSGRLQFLTRNRRFLDDLQDKLKDKLNSVGKIDLDGLEDKVDDLITSVEKAFEVPKTTKREVKIPLSEQENRSRDRRCLNDILNKFNQFLNQINNLTTQARGKRQIPNNVAKLIPSKDTLPHDRKTRSVEEIKEQIENLLNHSGILSKEDFKLQVEKISMATSELFMENMNELLQYAVHVISYLPTEKIRNVMEMILSLVGDMFGEEELKKALEEFMQDINGQSPQQIEEKLNALVSDTFEGLSEQSPYV